MGMTATIIDGREVGGRVRAEVAREVAARVERGAGAPGLATILVGDDPASAIYVANKRKACAEVGHCRPSPPPVRGCHAGRGGGRDRGEQPRSVRVRDPAAAAPAEGPAGGGADGDDLSGEGRRRAHAYQRRTAVAGHDGAATVHAAGRGRAAGHVRGGDRGRRGSRSSAARTSSASPWRRCCSSATPPSRSATRGPGSSTGCAPGPTSW